MRYKNNENGKGKEGQKDTLKKASGKFKSTKKRVEVKVKVKEKTNNVKEDEFIRLNKWLATSGVCSRRKADELIQQGVVKVNGLIVTELGIRIARTDFITVNGDPIKELNHDIYILLNKPKNVITTTSDELNRQTVLDIVKKATRVFPIGRLDRNTTGVLLITNDGELAYRLTHPNYSIERAYLARLDKALRATDAQNIVNGVQLEDCLTQPCELEIDTNDHTKVLITLREGRNHEIKRIFEHFGYEVKSLDRKTFAGLNTRGLARGEYRHLTSKEVLKLKKYVKL